MKVGFFTETFFPQVNGVSTSIASFTRELVRQGHEVEIFAPSPGPTEFEGASVHRFRSLPFKPYPEFRATIPPIRVNRLVKGKGFGVIHTHGPFAMGWVGQRVAKKNGIPCVTTFHTPISDYVQYLFGRRREFVLLGKKVAWSYSKRHYSGYDCVFSPSYVIKSLLEEKGFGPRIEVIRTGIDIARLDSVKNAESVRKKYGLGRFLLHAGRLSREKNVNDVISAMPAILEEEPDLRLVVTSRGPAMKELQLQAKKMGLADSVLFTGFVDDEDLARLYKCAECALIGSEAETQGLVIFEGMACGCPVVGADYLATPEAIESGRNGFLFPLHDTGAMAEHALKIVQDKRLRERLSRGARKTAEADSIGKWTKEMVGVYESLL